MSVYLPNFRPTEPRERRLQRALEMLPGAMAWLTFIGLAIFCFLEPWWMAIFILLYVLYWLIRVMYFTSLMVLAYMRMKREAGVHWLERAKGVSNLPSYLQEVEQEMKRLEAEMSSKRARFRKAVRRRLRILKRHYMEIKKLQQQKVAIKPWDSVYHLVVIATYREDYGVLETTVEALTRSRFPLDRIILVLAIEEREGASAWDKARRLEQKFGRHFYAFRTTCHPANRPGEARVKGANTTWAAQQMREWLDKRGIAYEDVVISVFDADTCVEPEYFGCLTYHYITRPDRLRCSYQPLPMYHNNIWDAPGFSRMAATITTYWQMVQSIRPDLLITFSSHAMSFRALVDANYWPVDVISDDSVIFFRCLLRYDGDYRTVPMFVAVHMDANLGKTYWQTFVSLYRQMRRWAWGAENLPLLIRGFLRNRVIPLRSKLRYVLQLMESHYTWSTAAVILSLHVWLALWSARTPPPALEGNLLLYHLPHVTKWMLNLGVVGMVICACLGLVILPPRPPQYPRRKWLWMAAQWLLTPVYYLVLATIPAIDAQTRMMLGKYLTFAVTEKHRTSPVGRPSAIESAASLR